MPIRPEALDEARRDAELADERAGVVTAEATPDDLDALVELIVTTWGRATGPDRSQLRASQHAGSTILVARRGEGVIGGAYGFLGWHDGLHVHSHMAAVDPEARAHGVGAALKLRQRELCLAHGIDEIRWTFDPLIRRNAAFNLVRLGAEVSAFLPDFYGRLDDAISAGDASDRFEVRWRLDAPRTRRALDRLPRPEWTPAAPAFVLDDDYEALRTRDLPAALDLRAASRRYFAALESDASLRLELDADRNWLLTRDPADRPA
ncbi:GNAT family N-acetyltransferase [Agromyces seonyuensis]|uniref:GNAT family N-acetyltransferase n=1 Tax=Agromyces seonyuensis TaxID=2662446 RepID=A0A6I4P8J3_9MICO|nr:GNAT family N-acetyltransferase [Agromyces seonyuensis]MWC00395.1 GNAT family N-acetyltransferase [Agromyces seonyuensis]